MPPPKPTATTPPRGKSANPTRPIAGLARSQYQRFEYQEIDRALIHNAPYNPRRISEIAKKRLRASLEVDGLVETLVWNRRTGHLVSGHRRLSILDQLEGSQSYTLGVAVIDVDGKREKALNVFLNNPHAQGTYDADLMVELLKLDDAPSLTDMGLTRGELELEIGQFPELLEVLGAPPMPKSRKAAEDAVEAMKVASKAQEQQERAAADPDVDPNRLVKERRQQFKDKDQTAPERDYHYHLVLRFDSQSDRDDFLIHNGFSVDVEVIDEALLNMLLKPEHVRPQTSDTDPGEVLPGEADRDEDADTDSDE